MVFVLTLGGGRFPIRLLHRRAIRVAVWWVCRRHFAPLSWKIRLNYVFTVAVPAANARRQHKPELAPRVRESPRGLYSLDCREEVFSKGRRRSLDDPEHPQQDQEQQYEGYNADDVCGTAQL